MTEEVQVEEVLGIEPGVYDSHGRVKSELELAIEVLEEYFNTKGSSHSGLGEINAALGSVLLALEERGTKIYDMEVSADYGREKIEELQYKLEQEQASAQALAAKYNATFDGLRKVGLVLDLTQAELERLG
jgi:hypothetical protein